MADNETTKLLQEMAAKKQKEKLEKKKRKLAKKIKPATTPTDQDLEDELPEPPTKKQAVEGSSSVREKPTAPSPSPVLALTDAPHSSPALVASAEESLVQALPSSTSPVPAPSHQESDGPAPVIPEQERPLGEEKESTSAPGLFIPVGPSDTLTDSATTQAYMQNMFTSADRARAKGLISKSKNPLHFVQFLSLETALAAAEAEEKLRRDREQIKSLHVQIETMRTKAKAVMTDLVEKARKEKTKLQGEVEKEREVRSKVEAELGGLRQQLDEALRAQDSLKEEKLGLSKSVDELNAKVSELSSHLAEAGSTAVTEFKTSAEYKGNIAEAALPYYEKGLQAYRAQLAETFPNDVSRMDELLPLSVPDSDSEDEDQPPKSIGDEPGSSSVSQQQPVP